MIHPEFILYFIAVVLLIYGYFHEEEIATWERKQLIKFIKFVERKGNKK